MNKRILSLFLAIVMVFGVVSPAFAAGFTPQNHLQKAAESELIADKGKLKAKLSLPKTEERPVRFMAMAMAKSGAEPGFGETKVTVNIAKHGIGSNDFAFDKVFGQGAEKTITLYDDADEATTPEQTVTFTSGDNVVEFATPIPMQHVKAGDVFIEFEGTHVAGKLTWEESDPSYSGGNNVTTYKLDLYQVRNTDVIVTTKTADGTEATNPTTLATNGIIKLGSLNKEIDIPAKDTTGVFTGKNIRVKDVDTLNADPKYSIVGTENGVLVDKTNKKVYKPGKFVVDEEGIKPAEVTLTEKPLVTEDSKYSTDPDYVAVTFAKGDHGTIAENKTYYVFKGVEMKAALSAPEVTPEEGYKFTSWNPDLTTKYEENTTHKAEYTKDTCLTLLALKEQFEEAAKPMFEGVAQRKDAYIGKFDETTHTVTVAIIDKDAKLTEMSGSGLIAGLTKLYKENKLTKIKISENDPIDLNAVWEYAKSVLPEADKNNEEKIKASFMGNLKVLIGGHVGNTLKNGEALDLNKDTLELFIDKEVKLNLTIEQPGCGNATNIVYTIKGVEAAASKLKDKLDPQDISVWLNNGINWKDGVKLKEADEDLQAILDKAKVTDLGENGTEEEPKTARTSAAKGKFTGNLLVTFEDGSKLVVENQNLYVYANGDEKPEDGKPLPTDSATVTFTKDDNSIKADGWETVKPIIVKKGTKVPDGKFPNAEAKDGYHTVAWTPSKDKVITGDQTFNASATKNDTSADKITKAGGLAPKATAAFVGDTLNWAGSAVLSDQAKQAANATELQGLLNKATITDATDPARTSEAAGEFTGKVKVTFEDKSFIEVDKQILYVYENGAKKPGTDKPVPTNSATVTFRRDEDSIKDWGTVDQIIVKKNEAVPDGKFPTAEAKDGYHTVAWTPAKTTVITGDQTFNASATKNVPTTSNAEDYDPHYTDKSGKPGETVQIAPPTFTKIGVTGNVPAPSDGAKKTTFTKNDNTQTNVTVDPNTGAITVKIPDNAKDGDVITVPVDVTYPDGSKETVDVKVTVKDKTTPPTPQGPSVIYPETPIDKGDTKTVTPDIKDKDGNPTAPDKTPEVGQPGNGVVVTPHPDGSISVTIPEDYDGPSTIVIPVVVTVDGEEIHTTLTIRVNDGGSGYEPGGDDWYYFPRRPRREIVPTISVFAEPEKKVVINSHDQYIFGYPDDTIRPDGDMTRAEAIAVVARLQKLDLSDKSSKIYKDTKADMWYNGAINAAFREGYLLEKEGENVRPNDKITRAELALLISHIDKKNSAIAPFEDVKGHKYEAAINQAYGNERIKGYPDGTFKPDNSITRAEVATMLNKLYDRNPDKNFIDANQNLVHNFKDMSYKGHWGYYELVEAYHSHTYLRLKDNMEEWKVIIK